MAEKIGIQIEDKFCLTIEEASRYFGIGEKKLRRWANDNLDDGFIIQNGVKILGSVHIRRVVALCEQTLIKRQRFEQFLNELPSI